MFIRIFAIAVFILCFAQPALACRYKPVTAQAAMAATGTAFIGTVKTVENGLAAFKAEKAIKGIKEGEELDIEITGDSCAIRFQPGQRWLYLGAAQPSGSLLLQDEYGRVMDANVKVAKEQLKLSFDDSGDTMTGTAERSCAPWDGAALAIKLGNNISALVYSSIPENGDSLKVYPADNKPEREHGSIVQCPQLKDGQAGNQPCKSVQGTISIGSFDGKTLTGNIEIKDGEYHSLYVFRVRWVGKQVFCG